MSHAFNFILFMAAAHITQLIDAIELNIFFLILILIIINLFIEVHIICGWNDIKITYIRNYIFNVTI